MSKPASIRVGASRKISDGAYGSVGAELTVEISLDGSDDPIEEIDRWARIAAIAVASQAARELTAAIGDRAAAAPATQAPPAPPGSAPAAHPARGPSLPPVAVGDRPARRPPNTGEPPPPTRGNFGDPTPADGRQLLGWMRRQQNAPNVQAWIVAEGKQRGLPSRILDWGPQDCADIFRDYTQLRIEQLEIARAAY